VNVTAMSAIGQGVMSTTLPLMMRIGPPYPVTEPETTIFEVPDVATDVADASVPHAESTKPNEASARSTAHPLVAVL
jgi:hypothetical protein